LKARGSLAIQERHGTDIIEIKQQLSHKADLGLFSDARSKLENAMADIQRLDAVCAELEDNKVSTSMGDKLQEADVRMNEALRAMETMMTCKADRADFSSLMAATEKGFRLDALCPSPS